MYKTLTISLVALAAAAANAHNTTDSITGNYPEGFTVTEIGKTARELCPDSVSPSTPLDFYRLRSWVSITGKKRGGPIFRQSALISTATLRTHLWIQH